MKRNIPEGFTMVEALVALVMLSIVLMALAPVLFQAVERQKSQAIRFERTGVLLTQANRLMAMPVDGLDPLDGTTMTVTDNYDREYEVDFDVEVTGTERRVKVRVAAPVVGADSLVFSRTE